MSQRIPALGLALAALGATALAVTPGHRGASAPLATAGSDVPIWGIVLVVLLILLGLWFIILGTRRRKDEDEEAEPRRSAGPDDDAAEANAGDGDSVADVEPTTDDGVVEEPDVAAEEPVPDHSGATRVERPGSDVADDADRDLPGSDRHRGE